MQYLQSLQRKILQILKQLLQILKVELPALAYFASAIADFETLRQTTQLIGASRQLHFDPCAA